MAFLNSCSQMFVYLLAWSMSNTVMYLWHNFTWMEYPLIWYSAIICLSFVLSCIKEASKLSPWKETVFSNRTEQYSIKRYLLLFGALAVIWALELIGQDTILSSVFTFNVYEIGGGQKDIVDEDSLGIIGSQCVEGTLPFAIKQFTIILVFGGSFFVSVRDRNEANYLMKTGVPVILLTVGAFFSVLGEDTETRNAKTILAALIWIIVRSLRILLIKYIQQVQHRGNITITRFVKLSFPLLWVLVTLFSCFTDIPHLISASHPDADVLSPPINWVVLSIYGMAKLFVWCIAFIFGFCILFVSNNGVDYVMLITAKEVITNLSCTHDVSGQTRNDLTLHQILGTISFSVGTVLYFALFVDRYVQIRRHSSAFAMSIYNFASLSKQRGAELLDEVKRDQNYQQVPLKDQDDGLEEQLEYQTGFSTDERDVAMLRQRSSDNTS